MSVLPLVLFELRHPRQNLGKFLQRSNLYSLQRLDLYPLVFIPQSLSRLLFPVTHLDGNLLKFYTWCREIADGRVADQPWWAVGAAAIVVIIPFVGEKFAKRHDLTEVSQTSSSEADAILRLMIISSAGGILVFKLLGGNLYDFYLAVLYPVVLLLAARAIDFIWRKWGISAGGLVLAVIVGFNLTAITRAYHPQGLAIKQAAVAWAAEKMEGKDFGLDSLSGCSRYNGVRYLFFLENVEPVKSFVDNDLSWLYPVYNRQAKPEYLVTFVTLDGLIEQDRELYNQLVSRSISRKRFGDIEVIIVSEHSEDSDGRIVR